MPTTDPDAVDPVRLRSRLSYLVGGIFDSNAKQRSRLDGEVARCLDQPNICRSVRAGPSRAGEKALDYVSNLMASCWIHDLVRGGWLVGGGGRGGEVGDAFRAVRELSLGRSWSSAALVDYRRRCTALARQISDSWNFQR